ncbi:hypothetical protein KAU43_05820 [candidate division WOR-3 bacterium]|nr:hypothetical protein [candidate division WOR-3 bacterium]
MGWKGESRRHSLSRKGIKTAHGLPIKPKTPYPQKNFYMTSRKITSSATINSDLEERILKEIRTEYKLPNNSYVIIEMYDETIDREEGKYDQTFVLYVYDREDELLFDGNGSFNIINAELTQNPTYPSITDFVGTLKGVSFDINKELKEISKASGVTENRQETIEKITERVWNVREKRNKAIRQGKRSKAKVNLQRLSKETGIPEDKLDIIVGQATLSSLGGKDNVYDTVKKLLGDD